MVVVNYLYDFIIAARTNSQDLASDKRYDR